MKVADRMVRNVITIEARQTLRDAIALLQKHHIRHVPVLDGKKLVGILTDRDVKRATPSPLAGDSIEEFHKVVDSTIIAQIMTKNPYCVTPATPLRDAVKILHDRKNGALPVVEGDRLVGLLTTTDMLMDLYNLLPE
jgi:acetoin utilization protein AcuB